MENTILNKEKFLSLYWDVPCINDDDWIWRKDDKFKDVFAHSDLSKAYAKLKPLSSITDEDAMVVGKIWYEDENTLYKSKSLVKYWSESEILETWCSNIVDFLRSKRYFLPYMDLTEEKAVEYGWVKLIS